MWGITIAKVRYSHQIISNSDGFVINVPTRDQVHIVDYCGTVSGRDVDKFKECNLLPLPSEKISAPRILEFPLNIECAIKQSVDLGSHTFFFGEIDIDRSKSGYWLAGSQRHPKDWWGKSGT